MKIKDNKYLDNKSADYGFRLFTATGGDVVAIGGKMNLKTKEVKHLLGSPRIFQRCRFHKWIQPLIKSRDALYPAVQILRVQERMQSGEQPPLLPSEIKSGRLQSSNEVTSIAPFTGGAE